MQEQNKALFNIVRFLRIAYRSELSMCIETRFIIVTKKKYLLVIITNETITVFNNTSFFFNMRLFKKFVVLFFKKA